MLASGVFGKNTLFIVTTHGTIIGTEIIYKKIPCYMRDSACRWRIIKKAKIISGFAGCEKMQDLIWSKQRTFHKTLNRISRLI